MPGDQVGGVPLRDYVDAQVAELRTAIGMLAPPKSVGVPLREHMEALLDERDRGRDKVDTQYRHASDVAEVEREKAARALRIELERSIEQGDIALERHIEAQIREIRQALVAANELELARIEVVTARLDTQFEAAQEAIKKSERGVEKEFEGTNEWRAQSADRERSQQEQMAALTSEFVRREVVEAQMSELRRSIQELTDKVNKLV